MQNFAQTKAPLHLLKIDQRFIKYLEGWKVSEIYKDNTVVLPDYVPFNYYAVYDKPGETENELQVSIWMGWASRSNGKDIDALYDSEVQVNLRLEGSDVLHGNPGFVKAEITKQGGAPMQVFFNGKMLTDFTDVVSVTIPGNWFSKSSVVTQKVTNGYQVIPDLSKYL